VSQQLIKITENAQEQILEIFKKDKKPSDIGLRIGVVGGGCSGLSYKIDFDDTKKNDNVFYVGIVKVIVDPKSSIYLKGITLDYSSGLNGKGFIFKNPNATNTCGCGESFSV
jgi:iron-sulfur cluster assembly protein